MLNCLFLRKICNPINLLAGKCRLNPWQFYRALDMILKVTVSHFATRLRLRRRTTVSCTTRCLIIISYKIQLRQKMKKELRQLNKSLWNVFSMEKPRNRIILWAYVSQNKLFKRKWSFLILSSYVFTMWNQPISISRGIIS